MKKIRMMVIAVLSMFIFQATAMKGYKVRLEGYYRVKNMTLQVGHALFNCKNGFARLLTIKPGITGLVISGTVSINPGQHNAGQKFSGAFLRFHPDRFSEFKHTLEPINKSPRHITCNNIHYLFGKRFTHINELYLLPARQFIGLSVFQKDFSGEKVYTSLPKEFLQNPDQHLELIRKMHQSKKILVSSKRHLLLCKDIITSWLEALLKQNDKPLQQYLTTAWNLQLINLFGNMNNNLHQPPENYIWDQKSLRCLQPVGFKPVKINGIVLYEYLFAECFFYDRKKTMGKLRLTIVRTTTGWKIINYQMSI